MSELQQPGGISIEQSTHSALLAMRKKKMGKWKGTTSTPGQI